MVAEELKGIDSEPPHGLAVWTRCLLRVWKLSEGWVVCAVIAKGFCLSGHTWGGLVLNQQWEVLLHPHTHPGRLQQPQVLRVSPGLEQRHIFLSSGLIVQGMIRGSQSLEVLGKFWENLPMLLSTSNTGGGLDKPGGGCLGFLFAGLLIKSNNNNKTK